jgi:8-oxo-dGTP diphosphatase
VGGKLEINESPDECARREILEETGLTALNLIPRGMVTFISDVWESEYMFLYSVTEFCGTLTDCNEGDLHWIDKREIFGLNLWDGDRIFLRMMMKNAPYFEMKLVYRGDRLHQCVIDGNEAELFDIMNEDGSSANYVAERNYAHLAGLWHNTVHIWLVRKNAEGKTEIMLQKRAACKDSHPGCYDISSAGHISAGDGVLESAVREIGEELGIRAQESDFEYVGLRRAALDSEFHGKPFHDREFAHVFLYRKTVEDSTLKLQKSEVESVMWVELEECLKAVTENTIKNCVHKEELEMIAAQLTMEN